MKCGSKKMAKGGMAKAGASRRMMAQEKAIPMKSGGIVVRGKGAATKGFKARGPMA